LTGSKRILREVQRERESLYPQRGDQTEANEEKQLGKTIDRRRGQGVDGRNAWTMRKGAEREKPRQKSSRIIS